MHRVLCVWERRCCSFKQGRAEKADEHFQSWSCRCVRSPSKLDTLCPAEIDAQSTDITVTGNSESVVSSSVGQHTAGKASGSRSPEGRHEDPKLLLQCFKDAELFPIPPTSWERRELWRGRIFLKYREITQKRFFNWEKFMIILNWPHWAFTPSPQL